MRKQLLTGLLAGSLAATMLPGVASANFGNGPSSAGIVERFTAANDFSEWFWFDLEDGLVVLAGVNSVADACPPFNPGAVKVQRVTLPSGVIVDLLHGDDVPVLVLPFPPPGVDPCTNPDAYPVIARGTGNFRSNANDQGLSGTRTLTYGSRLTGRVVDDTGTEWNVRAILRAKVNKDREFVRLVQDINLVKR